MTYRHEEPSGRDKEIRNELDGAIERLKAAHAKLEDQGVPPPAEVVEVLRQMRMVRDMIEQRRLSPSNRSIVEWAIRFATEIIKAVSELLNCYSSRECVACKLAGSSSISEFLRASSRTPWLRISASHARTSRRSKTAASRVWRSFGARPNDSAPHSLFFWSTARATTPS